jgi:3-oxoacyl-(acyl-carrier-protein) synthase
VNPDEGCELNHVMGKGKDASVMAALSSSFGFGGAGTVLLFEREDSADRSRERRPASRVVVTGASIVGDRGTLSGVRVASAPPPVEPSSPAGVGALAALEAGRSRRFDAQTALVTLGVERALGAAALSPGGVGLVVSTAFAAADRTADFLRIIADKGPRRAPPAEFPHLVPSAASGNASIYLGLSGPVLTTCALDAGGEASLSIACDLVESDLTNAVVAGASEAKDAIIAELLSPACVTGRAAPRAAGGGFVVVETADAAARRGARPYAAVHRRYEFARQGLPAAVLDPPRNGARPVVVSATGANEFVALLERSGWHRAERRTTASVFGWNEGSGAVAIAVAAGLVASGENDEALVLGWNEERVFAFHLVAFR